MVATAPPASARSRLDDAKSSRNTCGASVVSGVSPEKTPEMTPASSCSHLQARRGAETEVHRASHSAHRQQRRGGAASGASDQNNGQMASLRTHLNATVAHLLTSFTGPEAMAISRSTGKAPSRPAATPGGGAALSNLAGGSSLKSRGVLLRETLVVCTLKGERVQERGGACSLKAATRATPAQLITEELDHARQRLHSWRALNERG